MTLDDEDRVAAWVGAAGVPVGFRERVQPAAAAAASTSAFMQALAAHGVLLHADARQLAAQEPWAAGVVDVLKPLPWQAATAVPLLHEGAVVGQLTAIYREDEMPNEAETTCLTALGDQAATAGANARLLVAAREKARLEERQHLARELHDSVSQSLYGIQLGAKMARSASTRIRPGSPSRSTTSCDSPKRARPRCGL